MKKYRKVTDFEVLKKYYEIVFGIDYVPINLMAEALNTSKYQIRKIYKRLAEQGYMKIDKVCTYGEEYWNGLYDEFIPILYTKAYVLTNRGIEVLAGEVEQWKI